MSDQKVEYELSLKDGLSPTVDNADKHVNKLEHSLHSIKEVGLEALGALGVGFAIFKGFEFVEGAKEQWEQLEFATSQVEAGLKSTGEAAGISFEEIKASAQELSHELKFTQADVMKMQSVLLTFPSVTKDTFEPASKAILDMATRLGTDASGAAIQLGKALQDPVAGLNSLHRVGVNTDELKKKFETVTDTLQRQKLIIAELNTEFAGSAKAAAEADVGFRYEKSMEELKITIGEVADKLSGVLMPVLEAFANGLKATVEWMKEHKDLLEAIAIGVGIAATAWGIYTLVVNASAIATGVLTAATAAWNAVLSVSPLGWFLIILGAVTTAVIYCYKHFATFRATLLGVWETIKEFGRIVADIFTGVGKVILGVLTFSPKMVVEGAKQTIDAISDAGTRMGGAFKKGFDEGMADYNKEHEKDNEGMVPKKALSAKPLGQATAAKEPKSKATGSKSVTINVSIKDLIGTQNINTTTLKEGAGKIKDMVVQVLAGAVNDFQVVAEH